MKSLILIWVAVFVSGIGGVSYMSAQIKPITRLTSEVSYLPMSAPMSLGEPVLQAGANTIQVTGNVQQTQIKDWTYLGEDLQPASGYKALTWELR